MRNVPVLALLGLSAAFASGSASAQEDHLSAAKLKSDTAGISQALMAGARPTGALEAGAAADGLKADLLRSNSTDVAAALVGSGTSVRAPGARGGAGATDRLVATPEVTEAMSAGALNNAALGEVSSRLLSAVAEPDHDLGAPFAASLPAMQISRRDIEALGPTKQLGVQRGE